jgi:hypothetical protein
MKPSTQRSSEYNQKMKDLGLKRRCHWIPDSLDADKEFKAAAARIRKKSGITLPND